jgi:hypothetical protein
MELKPGVMRTCKAERRAFCANVVPGGARMFRRVSRRAQIKLVVLGLGLCALGAACCRLSRSIELQW